MGSGEGDGELSPIPRHLYRSLSLVRKELHRYTPRVCRASTLARSFKFFRRTVAQGRVQSLPICNTARWIPRCSHANALDLCTRSRKSLLASTSGWSFRNWRCHTGSPADSYWESGSRSEAEPGTLGSIFQEAWGGATPPESFPEPYASARVAPELLRRRCCGESEFYSHVPILQT